MVSAPRFSRGGNLAIRRKRLSTFEFYSERAADCRRQAAATNLGNVRSRCLNAASAWDDMAERVRRNQAYREEDAARKAAAPKPWTASSSN
jgi:hypothetical protein